MPQFPFHPVTYHPKSTNLDEERFRSFLTYSNGYVTAITNYPVYTTVDMGDIKLIQRGNTVVIECSRVPLREITMQDCMIETIQHPPLQGLTKIDITGSSIEDRTLRRITQLPETLKECILDRNKLDPVTILHLLRVLADRKNIITLSIQDIGFLVGHFEWIVRHDRIIAPLLRKWLFLCVMARANTSKELVPLQRINFALGCDRANPEEDLYVPAYVVPHKVDGKNFYRLQGYYSKKSYAEALKVLT